MDQEIQKKQKRKKEFQNLQENCKMQEKILLIFLKKEFFRIGVMYFKQRKSQKKTNFLNILRMKQKILTMVCSIIILILQNLVIWQKKLFEIKDKKKNNDFVKEIKNRWSKIKDEIEEMSEEKKEESNKMLKNC